MSKKAKYAVLVFIPLIAVLSLLVVLFFLNIIDIILLLLVACIILPYGIAYFIEYSKSGAKLGENLTDYELNLIQEKDSLIKTLEIIIISFSFLFGLFTAIEFDLQTAGVPTSIFLRLIGAPFGVDFFMGTFVFLQTQVFGKEAYLTGAELESLTTDTDKTNKIKNMLQRLHLANFTRRGCYYSLMLQICMIYPIVMTSVSI
jgi:hypothetical protein